MLEWKQWVLQYGKCSSTVILDHRRVADDDSKSKADARVRVDELPEALRRLSDVMLGINPSWDIFEWLEKRAIEELEIISMDLDAERLQMEQRMKRLDDILGRLPRDDVLRIDPNQRNLFDCFDLSIFGPVNHLAERAMQADVTEDEVVHPASSLLTFLPGEDEDDPLLAMTAQMVLMYIDDTIGGGAPYATSEGIFLQLIERGVNEDEIDEAIDHLLAKGSIYEIDDDCFIPEN